MSIENQDEATRWLRTLNTASRAQARLLLTALAAFAFTLSGCVELPSASDELSDIRRDAEALSEGQLAKVELRDNSAEDSAHDETEVEANDLNEDEPELCEGEGEREEDQHEEDRHEEDPEEVLDLEADEHERGGALNILPLGDSITEGVPFTYRHSLYHKLTQVNYAFDFVGSHTHGAYDDPEEGWDRDNEGWSGWTTESIEEGLSGWSSAYTVDVALIHLGTNDAGGDDVESSIAAMTGIIEQLRSNNSSVSICMAQILPFGRIPQEPGEPGTAELNSFVDTWNSRLGALAAQMTTPDSPIVLVDMNSDFGEADLDDGVHPTREGAEKMADRWLECIMSF